MYYGNRVELFTVLRDALLVTFHGRQLDFVRPMAEEAINSILHQILKEADHPVYGHLDALWVRNICCQAFFRHLQPHIKGFVLTASKKDRVEVQFSKHLAFSHIPRREPRQL